MFCFHILHTHSQKDNVTNKKRPTKHPLTCAICIQCISSYLIFKTLQGKKQGYAPNILLLHYIIIIIILFVGFTQLRYMFPASKTRILTDCC